MGLFDSQGKLLQRLTDPGRYVKDFRLEETTDEKGHVRRKAVYTGMWTVLCNPSAAKMRLWSSLLLSVLAAAMYIRILLLTHLTGARLEVMIPLLMGLFPLMYLLMGTLSLPFLGKPMRRDQYMHSFIRVSRSCTAVGCLVLTGLLITMILRAVWGNWSFFPEDLLFTVLCVLIILSAAGILLLLRGIEVTEKENAAFRNIFR